MKTGRPRIEIDPKEFRALCKIQCTLEEVAGVFDCSEDTIERWCKRELGITFAEAFKRYSAGGKASVRRYQFALAKKNATMAIWLGKQWLGQSDEIGVRNEISVDDGFIDALSGTAREDWNEQDI